MGEEPKPDYGDEQLIYRTGPLGARGKLSGLAVLAFFAPFLAFLAGVAGVGYASERTTRGTPAQRETLEMLCGLAPQMVAMALGIVAICRIAAQGGKLRGRGWAIAGLVLGGLLAGLLFFLIVQANAWLD